MFEALPGMTPELAAATLETWVAQEKQQLIQPGLELTGEEYVPLPGGVNAIRLILVSDSGHRTALVYAIIDGSHLQINIRGNLGLANPVLNTLRPA